MSNKSSDWRLRMLAKALGRFIGTYLLNGAGLLLLWDWLVPTLFGGPTITYWQAVGVIMAAGLVMSPVVSDFRAMLEEDEE